MNLLADNLVAEPVKYSDIQLKLGDIQLDLYKQARARGILQNTLQLQQFLVVGFEQMMAKLVDLDPAMTNGTIFPLYGNKPCFNYMSQWLRLSLLKCLSNCLPEDARTELDTPNLYKMDNPEFLPIYKRIYNYLILLRARETILWFFFQVPNYCNYNISGYRTVYSEICKYLLENWRPSQCFEITDYNATNANSGAKRTFEYLTLGTTWYYNMAYHGISNKHILKLFSSVLEKVYPALVYSASHIKPCTNKLHASTGDITKLRKCVDLFHSEQAEFTPENIIDTTKPKTFRKIKIIFISGKLSDYTSVFRDRIGIIKNIDRRYFDVWIGLFGDEKVVKAKILQSGVVNHFLESFTDHILYLSKTDVTINQRTVSGGVFDIVFYPDLGMLQPQTLLAHARLAPIQITTWGHSDTSGCNAIDYFVTSQWFEQMDDLAIPRTNYSEKPVLLTSLGTYYYSPRKILREHMAQRTYDNTGKLINIDPETKFITPVEFECTTVKPIVIGCLQSFYKFNDEFEALLESIMLLTEPMNAGGYPVYLALSNSISFNKKHLARINSRLAPYIKRIKWFQNKTPVEWLNLVSICKIMIDPFPFGGCNTSLEAFDYDIPVVCMPSGEMINGRFTAGFYNKMGLNHCIADSKQNYVQIVMKLIQDETYYEFVSQEIHNAKHKLFEEAESIYEYQEMFVNLVERHCLS